MKKIIISSLICMYGLVINAQTPYNTSLVGQTFINGTHVVYGNDMDVHSFLVDNTANVTLRASHHIKIAPTSNMSSIYAGAKFKATIDQSLLDVADMTGNWNPNKNERFEMGIKLPSTVQGQIDAFFAGQSGLNPYDPDQIKIKCSFAPNTTPSYAPNVPYVLYGFYYRDYIVQSGNWIEQPTPYTFRVRFAPPTDGGYSFSLEVFINGISSYSFNGAFNVNNTSHIGLLQLSSGNGPRQRFVSVEGNHAFFGIGQNIAYAGYSYNVATPSDYDTQRGYIADLKAHSGNFVRLRFDPWSNPLVGFSPTGYEDVYNYDDRQVHMWEFDKTLASCESQEMYIMLCLLQDQFFGPYNIYDPNTNGSNQRWVWDNNPYKHLINQLYPSLTDPASQIDAFFSNSAIRSYWQKTLFYAMARWGYSPNIALLEHINETDNVGQYQGGRYYHDDTHVSNGNHFKYDVNTWVTDMKVYIESNFYPWHPHTTGFAGGAVENLATGLNVWSENAYGDDWGENSGRNLRLAHNSPPPLGIHDYKGYWNDFKPFLFGEIGSACSFIDDNGDREFHNAIWAGTFSGALTTPLYWMSWPDPSHRSNFQALNTYKSNSGLDFNLLLFPKQSSISINGYKIYNFYLANAGTDITKAWGWAWNSAHYWRTDQNNSAYSTASFGCDGQSSSSTCYVTWSGANTILFENLENHSDYQIDYFNPYDGTQYSYHDAGSLTFSHSLNIKRPMDCGSASDFAYLLVKLGSRKSSDSSSVVLTDTIWADQNPYCVDVANGIDNYKNYSYNWDLGNGTSSTDTLPCVNYAPGFYQLKLCYIDSSGDTAACLKQNLVVMDSSSMISGRMANQSNQITSNIILTKNKISVFPVPSYGSLIVKSDSPIDKISVYDVIGNLQSVPMLTSDRLDISSLNQGTYFLHVYSAGQETIFKILKLE